MGKQVDGRARVCGGKDEGDARLSPPASHVSFWLGGRVTRVQVRVAEVMKPIDQFGGCAKTA